MPEKSWHFSFSRFPCLVFWRTARNFIRLISHSISIKLSKSFASVIPGRGGVFHHQTGSLYNSIVHCPICPKFVMHDDEGPALNTMCQYTVPQPDICQARACSSLLASLIIIFVKIRKTHKHPQTNQNQRRADDDVSALIHCILFTSYYDSPQSTDHTIWQPITDTAQCDRWWPIFYHLN